MAITVVGSTTGFVNNGGNVTLTFTGIASSDYIIVSATRGTSRTGAQTVTSSSGGSYTALVSTITSSGCQFSIWGQLVSSAGTPTQAIIAGTGGSSDSCCAVGSFWRGVRSSAPTDATTTSTTGNSSTPDSPSLTVVNADLGDVIITAIGQQATGVTLTPPTSYTSLGTISGNDNWDSAGGQAWLTYTSTAPVNPANWTSTLVAGWGSATIALATIPVIFTYQDYFPQYPDFYTTQEIVGY